MAAITLVIGPHSSCVLMCGQQAGKLSEFHTIWKVVIPSPAFDTNEHKNGNAQLITLCSLTSKTCYVKSPNQCNFLYL